MDPSAGFFYGLGFSLFHLALIVTQSIIKWPNIEEAKEYDVRYSDQIFEVSGQRNEFIVCQQQSACSLEDMNNFFVAHILGFVATFCREAFANQIRALGFINKFIEILALAVYFNALYRAIFELTTWSLRHEDYISIIHVLAKRGEQMDQNWGKITTESIGNST